MKNKKGFTLVELLCVIVIIAVVAVIGTVSMITIKSKMQKKTFSESLKTVLASAETFGSDNKELINEMEEADEIKIDGTNRKYYVTTVGDLLQTKYYDTEEKDEDGNETLNYYTDDNHSINDLKILVYETGNSTRVNACIPSSDMDSQFDGNLEIINDNSKEEFGDLGVYCTKTSVPGRTTAITLALTNENEWSKSKRLDITITVSDEDAKIAGYKISEVKGCKDDNPWITPSGSKTSVTTSVDYTEELDETGKTVYVCAKNNEGEAKSANILVNKIDNTAPTCGSTTGENTTWVTTSKTATVNCDDNLSGCVKATYNKTFTESAADGKGIITIADNAGNETDCSLNIYVDTVAPTCKVTGENTEWTKDNVTITYGCEDEASQCTKTTFGSKTYSEGTIETTTLNDTSYIIRDNAGNETDCSNTEVSVYLDKEAPSCKITGASTQWTNGNRTINYGCEDKGSGCKSGKSGSSETITTTQKFYDVPEYEIEDNVGNKKTCTTQKVNVYVDKTDPTCNITGENTEWTKSNVTISYGCSDSDSGCESATAGSKTYSSGTYKTVSIKNYTIKDKAGNTTNCNGKTANVYLDKTAPTCSVIQSNTTCKSGSFTAKVGCSDSGSGCEQSTYSQTFNGTTYYGYITIEDKLGNQRSCSVPVWLDNTPPVLDDFESDYDEDSIYTTFTFWWYDEGCSGVDDWGARIKTSRSTPSSIAIGNARWPSWECGDTLYFYLNFRDNAGNETGPFYAGRQRTWCPSYDYDDDDDDDTSSNQSQICEYIRQMKSNSQSWNNTSNESTKSTLHQKNVQIANKLSNLGLDVCYDCHGFTDTGYWYEDDMSDGCYLLYSTGSYPSEYYSYVAGSCNYYSTHC